MTAARDVRGAAQVGDQICDQAAALRAELSVIKNITICDNFVNLFIRRALSRFIRLEALAV